MNRLLVAASALTLITSVGVAGAAEYRGTIEKVDRAANAIVVDGIPYTMPEGMNIRTMQPGLHVVVTYDIKHGQRVASAVASDTTRQPSRTGPSTQ